MEKTELTVKVMLQKNNFEMNVSLFYDRNVL